MTNKAHTSEGGRREETPGSRRVQSLKKILDGSSFVEFKTGTEEYIRINGVKKRFFTIRVKNSSEAEFTVLESGTVAYEHKAGIVIRDVLKYVDELLEELLKIRPRNEA